MILHYLSMTIEHCPGRENELADALSRQPKPKEIEAGFNDPEKLVPPQATPIQHLDAAVTPAIIDIATGRLLMEEIINAEQTDSVICQQVER